MSLSKFGRAFLLGTSALVMTSPAATAGSFDITVDTSQNQVLDAGETGTVRAGVTLSSTPGTQGVSTVDIVGSGASLTNLGTIEGSIHDGGVRVRSPIPGVTLSGVTVTNSGTIIGGDFARAGFTARSADISGGVNNTGTISGPSFGIMLSNGSGFDISGGLNSRTNPPTPPLVRGSITHSLPDKGGSGQVGDVATDLAFARLVSLSVVTAL